MAAAALEEKDSELSVGTPCPIGSFRRSLIASIMFGRQL